MFDLSELNRLKDLLTSTDDGRFGVGVTQLIDIAFEQQNKIKVLEYEVRNLKYELSHINNKLLNS